MFVNLKNNLINKSFDAIKIAKMEKSSNRKCESISNKASIPLNLFSYFVLKIFRTIKKTMSLKIPVLNLLPISFKTKHQTLFLNFMEFSIDSGSHFAKSCYDMEFYTSICVIQN